MESRRWTGEVWRNKVRLGHVVPELPLWVPRGEAVEGVLHAAAALVGEMVGVEAVIPSHVGDKIADLFEDLAVLAHTLNLDLETLFDNRVLQLSARRSTKHEGPRAPTAQEVRPYG